MSKQKKLITQIGALFALLIMSVAVLSTTIASAATTNSAFNLDIRVNGGLCRTEDKHLRNTSSVQNAWGVNFQYSTESSIVRTKTTYWLGIDNPNGINPLGSDKYTAKEDKDTWYYYPAYAAASKKYVYLYASDNSLSNKLYSVSGYWNPSTGERPD